jgi:hypothetical protein
MPRSRIICRVVKNEVSERWEGARGTTDPIGEHVSPARTLSTVMSRSAGASIDLPKSGRGKYAERDVEDMDHRLDGRALHVG